jgi:hypothetical protein
MGLDNVWDKDTNLCGAQIRKDKSQSERHLLEKSARNGDLVKIVRLVHNSRRHGQQ